VRGEIRIGREGEFDLVAIGLRKFEQEGIRQHGEHFSALFRVVSTRVARLALFAGVADEALQPPVFFAFFPRRERTAIDGIEIIDIAVLGFNHNGGLAGRRNLGDYLIHPVGVVLILFL